MVPFSQAAYFICLFATVSCGEWITYKTSSLGCGREVRKDQAPLEKATEHRALGKEPGPSKSGQVLLMLSISQAPQGEEPRSESASGYVLAEASVWKGLPAKQL